MKVEICAHRGASGNAPENTLQAFALAIAGNADSIELDAHLTSDGIAVISHDGNLGRCCEGGSGHISQKTLAELYELNFCAEYPELGYCKIPTFEEVLQLIKPTTLKINAEIKGGDGIEKELARLVREYDMVDRVYYSSFSLEALVRIKQEEPRCQAGYLVGGAPEDIISICTENGFGALHCHFGAITADPALVERCHTAGIILRPWTVDDEADIKAMLNAGVDAIITNFPVKARYLRDGIKE